MSSGGQRLRSRAANLGAKLYGGSRKTRSNGPVRRGRDRRARPALTRSGARAERLEVARGSRPRRRVAVDEDRLGAPRDSASMPSAPEPANRSSTRAPSTRRRGSRRAPRGRGRRSGAWSARRGAEAGGRASSPARRPLTPAIGSSSDAEALRRRVAQQRVLRRVELGVAGEQLLARGRAPARAARRPRGSAPRGTAAGRAGACRAPRPPRAAQVDLGELKPSRCSASASSRGSVGSPNRMQSARVLAAADPPAQLVQLRDPVALGGLDHHHGRVRHVDADLDHARRDEHVGVARRRTPASPPASASTASARGSARTRWSRNSVAWSRSASASRPSPEAPPTPHERADDEHLAPGGDLLAGPLVGPRAARARRRPTYVSTGLRPAGSSCSVVTSRSP